MNWDQIKGDWKQVQGKVKAQWGKLTDDDLQVIDGKRDELAGKLQHHYGIAKEKAEADLDNFIKALSAVITVAALAGFGTQALAQGTTAQTTNTAAPAPVTTTTQTTTKKQSPVVTKTTRTHRHHVRKHQPKGS